MLFLRWLGGLLLLTWLIVLIIQGSISIINILIIFSALVFTVDAIFERRKTL